MKIKEHKYHLLIIILLAFFIFYNWLNLYEMPYRGDMGFKNVPESGDLVAYNAVNAYIIRDSLINKHDLTPLWNPFFLSGTPLFIKPQVSLYSLQTIFLLLSPNSWLGIKLSIIFHVILAGISMYLLIVYLKLDKKIALASSILFMANTFILGETQVGHVNILYPYSLIPLITLFALKSVRSKEWLTYSIITGLLMALQIHSGGQSIFLFTTILFGYILFFHIFGKDMKKRIFKMLVIGIIVSLVLLGLTAIKVLPSSEFVKISSRSAPFTYERSTSGGISLSGIFLNGPVSILILLLAIPSLFYYRKKNVLLFTGMMLLVILILTASPAYHLMWKNIPFLDTQKGIYKSFFIFILSASVLAAYGMSYILSIINKNQIFKNSNLKKNIPYIFTVLMMGIFLSQGQYFQQTASIKEQIENNHVLQYISKQPDKFRFHNFETNGIDWGIGHVSVPLKLEDVYGYDNIWLPEYLPVYLSIANSQRAKLFGVLNMKYLTSMQPLNITGFKFVKKFDDCGLDKNDIPLCQPLKSSGPYLYENKLVLPRAFVVDNAILIVGNQDQSLQVMYALMLNNNFNPSSTTIVLGEQKIDGHNQEFLNKFNAIILLPGSVDSSSSYLLENYVNSGGKLFPDITKNVQSFTIEEIGNLMKEFYKEYDQVENIDLVQKTYDNLHIDIKGKRGFLVLSEKFSVFPGWVALNNDGKEKKIYRANGIVSVVNLDGNDNTISFKYSPPKYKMGLIISSLTLIVILSYFIYIFMKRKGGLNKNRS